MIHIALKEVTCMKPIAIKCPNCGKGVYLDKDPDIITGRTRCYCPYCQEPLIVEDGIDRHVNININYDRTREREFDVQEERYHFAFERLEQRRKSLTKWLLVFIAFAILGAVLIVAAFNGSGIVGGLGLFLCADIFIVIAFYGILIILIKLHRVHKKQDMLDKIK